MTVEIRTNDLKITEDDGSIWFLESHELEPLIMGSRRMEMRIRELECQVDDLDSTCRVLAAVLESVRLPADECELQTIDGRDAYEVITDTLRDCKPVLDTLPVIHKE